MRRTRTLVMLACALSVPAVTSCGGEDEPQDEGLRVLAQGGIEELAFISRPKRTDVGDVFHRPREKASQQAAATSRACTASMVWTLTTDSR